MAKKVKTTEKKAKITGFLIDPAARRIVKVSIGGPVDDAVYHSLKLRAGQYIRSRQFTLGDDETVNGLIVYDKEPSNPSEIDRVSYVAVLDVNGFKLVLHGKTLLLGYTFAGSCETAPLTVDEVKRSVAFAARSYVVTHHDGSVQTMSPEAWNRYLA